MHITLHPRNDVDNLYVSRKVEGRELSNIEDCVNETIQGIKWYTKKS